MASILAARTVRALAAVCVLLGSAPPQAVAAVLPLDLLFDRVLYGDFALVGNTVTECPANSRPCQDARDRNGRGVWAQNNAHVMGWADADDDPATFNSSTAEFAVPQGARVVHATLTWAGNEPHPNRPCGGSDATPAGAPDIQAVSLKVNAQPAVAVAPERFAVDAAPGQTDERFYSARADVTARLTGASGPVTVTVGNVWTPRGRDCFGGWSLTAVWAFDAPTAPFAVARRRVQVYDGHTRVRTDNLPVVARASSVRSAGGQTRIGVVAYEGDWAATGDRLLVNDKAQAEPSSAGRADDFFVAAADGARMPRHLNNMSVDAKTIQVGEDTIRAGATSADLTFTGGRTDAFLVRGVAISAPLPELQLALTGPKAAHPGDQVAHTAQITNVGAAPAAGVQLRGDHCAHDIARIDPGQTVTVQCAVTAPDSDYRLTATVTGASLAKDELTAQASSSVDVLHPALGTARTATPDTVLGGQAVNYQITLRNNGDTPLSSTSLEDDHAPECRRGDLGTLAPSQQAVVNCTGTAPEEDFTATSTVSGTDELGKRVTAQDRVNITVLHPRREAPVPPPLPPQPIVRPTATRSELPVPTPVIVIGLALTAMSLTVGAIARPKR